MAILENRFLSELGGATRWSFAEWALALSGNGAAAHVAGAEAADAVARVEALLNLSLRSGIDFGRDVACIMGIPFDLVDMNSAVTMVHDMAAARRPCAISTANVNWLVSAREAVDFRDSILTSQACLIDGMPVLWLGKLMGLPVKGRVSGAGLFERLCQPRSGPKLKVFLFGGPDGTAEKAFERINAMNGGVECVGWDSPGYGPMESLSDAHRLERINAAGADFLIVALGASRGQAWIQMNQHRLNAPVISHLGAVVNFAAGTLKRAPAWIQRMGMEWAWRIQQEPKLWRRYVADGKAFGTMLATRALPMMVARAVAALSGAQVAPRCTATQSGTSVELKLSGDWTRPAAGQLRTLFHAAAAANTQVVIDLSGTVSIDASCMGKFLLLFAHQRAIGEPMLVIGVSDALRRQFFWHGAEFLLGQPGV